MAITSLKLGISTRSGMAGNTLIYPGSYESIASVDPSGTTRVTFTSIPQTFKHLQIRGFSRGAVSGVTYNAYLKMPFNYDRTTSYNSHFLSSDGSSATASTGGASSYADLNVVVGSAASANFMASYVVDILDYGDTNKYKTVRSFQGTDLNGSGKISFESNIYMSTTAISTIEIFYPGGEVFGSGSSFALYGIA
jgi:hypothetical protein